MQTVHGDIPSEIMGIAEKKEELSPKVSEEATDESWNFFFEMGQTGYAGGEESTHPLGEENERNGKAEEKGKHPDEHQVENEKVRCEPKDSGWDLLGEEKGEGEEKENEAQRIQCSPDEGEACGFPKGETRFREDVNFCNISSCVGWSDAAQKVS